MKKNIASQRADTDRRRRAPGWSIVAVEAESPRLYVAREAVVETIVREMFYPKNRDLLAKYQDVQELWQQWLSSYWERIPVIESIKLRMLECKPEGAVTQPSTTIACGQFHLCPWCYMRDFVGVVYDQVRKVAEKYERRSAKKRLLPIRFELLVGRWKPRRRLLMLGNRPEPLPVFPMEEVPQVVQELEDKTFSRYYSDFRKSGGQILGKIARWNLLSGWQPPRGIQVSHIALLVGRRVNWPWQPMKVNCVEMASNLTGVRPHDRHEKIRDLIVEICAYPTWMLGFNGSHWELAWLSQYAGFRDSMFQSDGFFEG